MANKTYNAKNVNVSLNGVIISGFDDDSVVEISRNNDSYSLTAGADGVDTTRSATNDKTGTIIIKLKDSSSSNAILSAFQIADELSDAGTFTIVVKHVNDGFSAISNDAFVMKPADRSFEKEAGAREWSISCPQLSF